jgi:hypothetical protein
MTILTDILAPSGLATAAQGTLADNAAPASSVATLSGRNLIINGSGRVNQRVYVSGAATGTANQFTLDRWFVVTSGQNLAFTGTDAGRVMTAPAGGVSQVIEGNKVVGGTYIINWTGTATATVGGVSRAKGDTFTLTANTNVTVRFSSGTFSEVQVEVGTVATPFERVDRDFELSKCQAYYWRGLPLGALNFASYAVGSLFTLVVSWPVQMIAAPTTTSVLTGSAFSGCSFFSFAASTVTGARFLLTSTLIETNCNVSFGASDFLVADAEIIV